jgi:hypothetical protein
MWVDNGGDEIEGLPFPAVAVVPRVGDKVHYWQDGFPDAAGVDTGIRLDFTVTHVEHDLRHMPRGTNQFHHTLIITLQRLS